MTLCFYNSRHPERHPSTQRVGIPWGSHYLDVLCHHSYRFSFWAQTCFKPSITVQLKPSSCIEYVNQGESLIFPVLQGATGLVQLGFGKSNSEHVMNVYTKICVTVQVTGITHINIWVRQVVHKKEKHDSLLFKHENCILRKYFQSSS